MADLPAIIAAVTGLVTAIGVIIAAFLAYHARVEAATAKEKVAALDDQLVQIGNAVFRLGPQIDGRLTELLVVTGKEQRATGVAEGIAKERADPQTPVNGDLHP